MLWREAHLSGKSWRFSCCWSPPQTDALSDEVQHEWSEGLQLALHLLFDFQEQAGVWTEVIPLLCGLQFVQYSLCYSTPICCFDLIHHSYGGIEHLPSKWRWIAHCVWRLAAAQGGRQVLESSLTNEKCCTMVLIKTGAFSEGSEQGLECWACFLLLAGGFWRRSSSLECLSPCYNCCRSFWQAAASGVILLAYRAGEILWFCVCPVSTEHNFSCKIMTLSSIELVQHCTLLSYEMSMTCSGVSLDEGEDVQRCCHNSSRAFGWWILLQTFLFMQTPRPRCGRPPRDGLCAVLWARLKSLVRRLGWCQESGIHIPSPLPLPFPPSPL